MKKLRFLISLITEDNDFQVEQAAVAEETARRIGVDIQIIYADNDPINQSQQLLKVIQGPANDHPDGIVLEPVSGTALPQVARAAAAAGIGWAVINREPDYVPDLRRTAKAPIFSVSCDHLEIGRIQGQQFASLCPKDGTAVYIQGPSDNIGAKQRATGMQQSKPPALKLIMLKGQWTEESAYRAVSSWMRLSTSQKLPVGLIAAQNDAMAMGARKALQELTDPAVRDRWLALPYIGCDGVPKTGQSYVRSGLLAATVVIPPNTKPAIEILAESTQKGTQPPALSLTVPSSFPPLDQLNQRRPEKSGAGLK